MSPRDAGSFRPTFTHLIGCDRNFEQPRMQLGPVVHNLVAAGDSPCRSPFTLCMQHTVSAERLDSASILLISVIAVCSNSRHTSETAQDWPPAFCT